MKRLAQLGRCTAAALLALCSACHAESAPAARGEVGVAPFAASAGDGAALPDIASQLAEQLGGLGIGSVLASAALGAQVSASPSPAERAALRERTGARTLVVGSATRLGGKLSLDARLLDLETGLELGPPLVEQASGDDDLARAIRQLAQRVAERIREPAPAAQAPEAAAKRPSKSKRKPGEPREPIEIQADQLDAEAVEGGRRLVFAGQVRAEQGDVKLTCDHLEAFYPSGASEPDQLIANGHIKVSQGERTAACDDAVFYRAEDRIVCRGKPAVLTQKCNIAQAERITFYLDTEKLEMVRGKVVGRECEPGAGASQ